MGKRISARDVARRVLERVDKDGAYSNLALGAELDKATALKVADRSLATEIVYGVLRYQRLLDHLVQQHANRRLDRMDPRLLIVLRVAAYQKLFLDRVPDHAVVNDAVNAAKRVRGDGPSRFTNAVLRKLSLADLEALPNQTTAHFALRYALPDPMAKRLVGELGEVEAERLAKSLLERAPLTLRWNSRRGSREAFEQKLASEGATLTKCTLAAQGYRVKGLPTPFQSESFEQGLWTAQDEAAQLVAELLEPSPGERVFDACAGVGGKALALADLLGPSADPKLMCADISDQKLLLLDEHMRRLGLSARYKTLDLTESQQSLGEFDAILLDAPCSALGTLRRHPELKWRFQRADVKGLVGLQRRLLERCVERLAPAGRIVYAVCTFVRDEGPAQLEWLLQKYPDLVLEAPVSERLADIAPGGVLKLMPHEYGTDGFFAARLRKQ